MALMIDAEPLMPFMAALSQVSAKRQALLTGFKSLADPTEQQQREFIVEANRLEHEWESAAASLAFQLTLAVDDAKNGAF